MIVCLKCNDCGNEFFVEDTVIKEYEARQKMANSLNTQAMFAGASQLLDQLSGKSDFSSMETYIKLRDINVLNAESKMLKNGNPFICPNCGSENTRFMTKKEINVYMENLQSEIEDKEKQEKAKNRKINPNATLEQLKERILLFIEDGEWYEAEHYVEHTLDIATTDYYLYYLQFLIMNRCKNNSGLLKKGIGFDKRNKIVSKIFKYADKDFLANLTRHNLNLQINNLQGSPIKLLESYKDISKNFDINDPLNKLNYKKFIQSIKNFDLKTQDIRFIIDAFKNEIFTKEQSAEIINAINDILEKNFSENEHSVFQILNCLNSNNINLNENLEVVKCINADIEKQCIKVINQVINQNEYVDYATEILVLKQIKSNSLNILYDEIIEKINKFINNDILDFEKIDEKNIDYVSINKDLERFDKVKDSISNLELSFPAFDVLIDKFELISKNIQQNEKNYSCALNFYNNKNYKEAFDTFNKISKYKDSEKLAKECNICIEKRKNRINKILIICKKILVIIIISLLIVLGIFVVKYFGKQVRYNNAISKYKNQEYEEVIKILVELDGFKQSNNILKEVYYDYGIMLNNNKKYDEALKVFNEIKYYKDSKSQIQEVNYNKAMELYNSNDYDNALRIFNELGSFKESKLMQRNIRYNLAVSDFKNKNYNSAIEKFKLLGNFKDSKEMLKKSYYDFAMTKFDKKEYLGTYKLLSNINYDETNQIRKDSFEKLSNNNKKANYNILTSEDKILYVKESIKQAKIVNDYDDQVDEDDYFSFCFGNDASEWLVLSKNENEKKALIIRKKSYDSMNFNEDNWEKSEIRKFLNGEYYNSQFNKQEKEIILSSSLKAEEYDDTDTIDKIFILSWNECKIYLKGNEKKSKFIWSLLRTSGFLGSKYYINAYGDRMSEDYSSNRSVYPVMWVTYKD